MKYAKISDLFIKRGYRLIVPPPLRSVEIKKIYVNGENFRTLSYKGISLYDASIYSICVELELFPEYLSFSDKKHRLKIEEWYGRCVSYIDEVVSLFEKHRICKSLIWQGYFSDAVIVRAFSILRGIPVQAFENTSNKSKMVWDDVSGITVNKNLASNYFWRHEKLVDPSLSERYAREAVDNIHKLKAQDHSTPDKKFSKKTSNPLVVMIGQVYTDASTLFGLNKGFSDPLDIIKILVDYSDSNNIELMIKLHPKEARGLNTISIQPYNKLTWRKICSDEPLKHKIDSSNLITVDYDNKYNTYSIIDNADAVVTINSQAGLEALAMNKEVAICGQCYYGDIGITHNAQDRIMLKRSLDLILKEKHSLIDREVVNKFFYIFFERYCINKSEKDFCDLVLR